jgi:hypothetical protein
MAGAGYKLFNTGDVLTAAQVNTYLQEQVVMRFATVAARTTALSGVLAEGMVSYIDATDTLEVYNGTAWISAIGDITEVQGSTGISVASGTGPVPVITNSMATAIDAKGDLIAGTGADAFSRLAVGANNTVLTADSSTATGLKWASASSTPSFVGCSVYKSGGQTLTTAVTTALTFDNEDWDTDGFHDNSTNNSRFTIPTGKGGKYLIDSYIALDHYLGSGVVFYIDINKNGSLVWSLAAPYKAAYENMGLSASTVVNAAAGDYFVINITQSSGNNATVNGGIYNTRAQITYLGA